jgi:hypothetical protein
MVNHHIRGQAEIEPLVIPPMRLVFFTIAFELSVPIPV